MAMFILGVSRQWAGTLNTTVINVIQVFDEKWDQAG